MSKASLSNSGNIILDLYQWRKPLAIFTLIASVLAAVVSSPLIITPKFKSTAVIYPTTTNSISQALKSLEKQEVILSEKSFYLYLGSFENQNSANKKLSEINKIDQINLIANFSVIKKMTKDNKSSYSVVSTNNFFHEKALDYCNDISSHNLECKIISDL